MLVYVTTFRTLTERTSATIETVYMFILTTTYFLHNCDTLSEYRLLYC